MLRCLVHDVQVTGWEVRTSYVFEQGRSVRSLEEFHFPCSCVLTGAEISTEEIVSAEESKDGQRLIQLQIRDMAGAVALEWFETRTADTW